MAATNLRQQALYIALAVLTKSAAALLVDRYLKDVPSHWCVVAVPYFDKSNTVDFDELMGNAKPFDTGLKTWIRPVGQDDWFAIYRARDLVLYLLFLFSGNRKRIEDIARTDSEADCLLFEGARLMDLVGYQWRKVESQRV